MSEMSQKEEYLYIIKNHDIQKLINDSDLPESDKNVIKEKVLSNDVDLSEKLKILNYLLKYQRSEYYRGQVILDTDEDEQLYKINEPGYYSIEIIGANGGAVGINKLGLAKDDTIKNFILNGKIFIDETNNTRMLYFTTDFKWIYLDNSRKKGIFGNFELNEKAIFLHKDYEFIFTEDVTVSNISTFNYNNLSKEIISTIKEQFYDYSSIVQDPFDVSSSFYKKLFFKTLGTYVVYEGVITEENKKTSMYDKISVMKGFGVPDSESDFYNAQIFNYPKYGNFINDFIKEEKIGKGEGEIYDVSKQIVKKPDQCIEFDFARNITEVENKSPGGSGGYFNKVIKITKSVDLSYSVGRAGNSSIKNPTAGEETNITFKKNKVVLFNAYAQGGKSTKDGITPIIDSKSKHNNDLYQNKKWINSIDRSDYTLHENKIKFSIGGDLSKNGTSNLDRFSGRASYDNYSENGILSIIDDKVDFYGGGNIGQGVQLNNFENAYYSNSSDGRIIIKYLGPISSEKFNIKVNTENEIKSSIIEEFAPAMSRIKMTLKMSSTKDSLDFKKSMVKCSDGEISLSEFIDNKDAEVIIKKNVNFYSFEFNVLSDYEFTIKENDKIVYCEQSGENEQIISVSSSNNDYLSLVGSVEEQNDITLIFKDLDLSIDSSINQQYNYTSAFENEYSSLNRKSNLSIKSKYNFFLIQQVKKSYEFNLKRGNTLDLESKYDLNNIEILKGKTCKIEKIYYSFDLKNFNEFTKSLTLFEGQKIYIKIIYNSCRVRISKTLSGLDESYTLYGLNYDLETNTYTPKEDDSGFQYILYEQGNSSQIKILNIEANTFKVSLRPDLYETLDFKTIDNKEEYEYGEEVVLSSNLKKDLYFSLRNIDKNDLDKYNIIPNDKEVYESSILVGKSKNTIRFGYDIQYSDKKDTFKEKLDGYLNSDRIFKYNNKNYDGMFFCLREEDRKFSDCLSIIRFKMPENNITIRLTSDFNYNTKILNPIKMESKTFVFGKNLAVRYIGSGGNTGNGGSGSNGQTTPFINSCGGSGGSGFNGGGAGSGGNTSNWQVDPMFDAGISSGKGGFHIYIYAGIVLMAYAPGKNGLPGEGFYDGGLIGGEGRAGLEYKEHDRRNFTTAYNPDAAGKNFNPNDTSTYGLSKYRGRFIDAILLTTKEEKRVVQSLTSFCGIEGFNGRDGIGSSGPSEQAEVFAESAYSNRLTYAGGGGNLNSAQYVNCRTAAREVDGKSGAAGTAGVPSFLNSSNSKLSIIAVNKRSLLKKNNDTIFQSIILGGGVDGFTSKVLQAAASRHPDNPWGVPRAGYKAASFFIIAIHCDYEPGAKESPVPIDWQTSLTESYASSPRLYTPYMLYSFIENGDRDNSSERNKCYDNSDQNKNNWFRNTSTHVKRFGEGSNEEGNPTNQTKFEKYLASSSGKSPLASQIKDIFINNSTKIVIPSSIKEEVVTVSGKVQFNSASDFFRTLKNSINLTDVALTNITDSPSLAEEFRNLQVKTDLGFVPNSTCASEVFVLGEYCDGTNVDLYKQKYNNLEFVYLNSSKSNIFYERNWFFTNSSTSY